MKNTARVIRLSEGPEQGRCIRFLSDRVDAGSLSETNPQRWVTVTRTGTFYDPRYGKFDITKDMLMSMVDNFNKGSYGQDIILDLSHEPHKGGAATFLQLSIEGDGNSYKLRGLVKFTPYGVDAVKKRGFVYLSAEYSENYVSNEEPFTKYGPLLKGAALTPRPVIKGLDKVELSEGELDSGPVLVSDRVIKFLAEEHGKMEKLVKQLRAALEKKKLAEKIISKLVNAFENAGEPLQTEEQRKALMESFINTGDDLVKQLTEMEPDSHPVINLSIPGATGVTAEDVKQMLAEERDKEAKASKKLAEDLSANTKKFDDLLDANEGVKNLSEDKRKELDDFKELITADSTDDQINKLAQRAIAMGEQLEVNRQLSSMGFGGGPSGTVYITVDESNNVKALQESADKRLGIDDLSDTKRYERTGGTLLEENKKLADKVLAQYDALHAQQLHTEHKMLAGGDGIVSDVAVPAIWERTVIREALYQLVGLQFVDVGTADFATSYMIPYSYRDTTAAGRNNTRRYEGQSIERAGVIQTSETAYNTPQKLSFEVSDELRLLTQANHLNWEAVSENQRNASRIIGEDLEQLLFNEQLRAADEYAAVVVADEVRTADVDGTNNVFPLANFPVVHPRSVYDLQGNQVGSTVNAITVTLGGSGTTEYDGTGEQAPGNYYTMDYNLGELRIVDETGVLQTPANTTALVVSYSYAANTYKFDTDLGGTLTEDHWNTFLYRYGLRKTVIEDERFHMANFGLMSGTVANQIEQAKQFAANFRRPGTELSSTGNVGVVKDIANYKTTAPGLWMGDQRIVIGERGQTRLRMTKPWSLGELENQKDANGRFTGKKEAYGDQFVVVHTPTQLKQALTTMSLYSTVARIARAE